MPDIDPSLRRAARQASREVLTERSLRRIRIKANGIAHLVARRRVPTVQVSATASVRLHRFGPAEGPRPAVLWLHAGGFVMGSARADDRPAALVARATGAVVAVVDYRLAPEHPYPAAPDDCFAALTWLLGQPDVDRTRVAVHGSSAGGGLAVATALRCHDENLAILRGLALTYPALDDRTVLHTRHLAVPAWRPGENELTWRCYLGAEPGAEGIPEYAAPARRADLTGLPPTWIGVGTADLFHDEDLTFAERLRAAGVPVTLEVVEGAFHGFEGIARRTPIARAFIAARTAAIARCLD